MNATCSDRIHRLPAGRTGQWGLFLLSFIFFTVLIAAVLFLSGRGLVGLTVPSALIMASLTVVLISADRRGAIIASLWGVAFVALTAAVNSLIYDTSFDSMGYHNDITVMMAEGWNPVASAPPNGSVWAAHYAKFMETAGAAMLALTGNLQSAKCMNFVLAGSAMGIMWHALAAAFRGISTKWRIMLVVMAALNPVAVAQCFSAYNDFCIWLETILLVSAFMLLWRDGKDVFAYIVLFMTVAVGVDTKFTHFFYVGLECLFFAGWCCWFRRYRLLKPGFIAVMAAVAAGVCVIGYNPYVLNTIGYANPVYPLATDGVDIMTGNTPAMFLDGNRLINFVKSLTSVYDAPWGLVGAGCIRSEAVARSYGVAAAVNGFGVLMLPMLICGFILMIINRPAWRWWALYASVFLMCLCFEQSWWARYVPFLWMALLLPVVVSLTGRRCRSAANRRLRACIFALCCINGALSAAITLSARLSYTHYINYVFTTQKQTGRPIHAVGLNRTMRQQFRERGVDIIEHGDISDIEGSDELFRIFGTEYFDACMLLPARDYPDLYRSPATLADRLARYDRRRYRPEPEENR